MSKDPLVIIDLKISITNDELLDFMRLMRTHRQLERCHIVLFINGFGEDKRELWEIPEVRAFCRRLVDIGFISYLDSMIADKALAGSLTALEVWLTAQGRMSAKVVLREKQIDEFFAAICEANEAADKAIGPHGAISSRH